MTDIQTASRETVNKAVGKKLQELRRKRKLTQDQLAALMGIHKQTLYGYENGHYSIPVDKLMMAAFHLGAKVSDFVTFREIR